MPCASVQQGEGRWDCNLYAGLRWFIGSSLSISCRDILICICPIILQYYMQWLHAWPILFLRIVSQLCAHLCLQLAKTTIWHGWHQSCMFGDVTTGAQVLVKVLEGRPQAQWLLILKWQMTPFLLNLKCWLTSRLKIRDQEQWLKTIQWNRQMSRYGRQRRKQEAKAPTKHSLCADSNA